MGFINDWMFYNQGDECAPSFHLWSAISILTACAGHKIYFPHGGGRFPIYPNLYVVLVGPPGTGKSTAKNEVKSNYARTFPNALCSASIQSREDLIKKMGADSNVVLYIDKNKQEQHYRPYYVISNELASFLSVDPRHMVEFLVDIYDEKFYATGFKNTDSQSFINPYLSLIACAVPEWFMFNLKQDVFSGGLGRRLTLVYETQEKFIADPTRPVGWESAHKRCMDWLVHLNRPFINGAFVRTDAAAKWWKSWYEDASWRQTNNPILRQFFSTKHIQLIKVAMAFALSETLTELVIDAPHFEIALLELTKLEPNIVKLTTGIGRNEIAPYANTMMEALEKMGGFMPRKKLEALMFPELKRNGQEFEELLKHLRDTDQIIETTFNHDGVNKLTLFTIPKLRKEFPTLYEQWAKERGKQNGEPK